MQKKMETNIDGTSITMFVLVIMIHLHGVQSQTMQADRCDAKFTV